MKDFILCNKGRGHVNSAAGTLACNLLQTFSIHSSETMGVINVLYSTHCTPQYRLLSTDDDDDDVMMIMMKVLFIVWIVQTSVWRDMFVYIQPGDLLLSH